MLGDLAGLMLASHQSINSPSWVSPSSDPLSSSLLRARRLELASASVQPETRRRPLAVRSSFNVYILISALPIPRPMGALVGVNALVTCPGRQGHHLHYDHPRGCAL